MPAPPDGMCIQVVSAFLIWLKYLNIKGNKSDIISWNQKLCVCKISSAIDWWQSKCNKAGIIRSGIGRVMSPVDVNCADADVNISKPLIGLPFVRIFLDILEL